MLPSISDGRQSNLLLDLGTKELCNLEKLALDFWWMIEEHLDLLLTNRPGWFGPSSGPGAISTAWRLFGVFK